MPDPMIPAKCSDEKSRPSIDKDKRSLPIGGKMISPVLLPTKIISGNPIAWKADENQG
jgi:hypothetical protein